MLLDLSNSRKRAMDNAGSYPEWLKAAEAYDASRGLLHWRKKDETDQYDYVSLRMRLDELRRLKLHRDMRGLLYNLNEGIHGNDGGMGKSSLYEHALSGTKHLIEDYVDEVVDALDRIDAADSDEISDEEKRDFMLRAQRCFGRSALLLSSSGSLLYFHFGVAKALLGEGLLPKVISGSSGGSIVGSLLCTHTDDELNKMLNLDYVLADMQRSDSVPGAADRGVRLAEDLKRSLPDLSFQQSYEKSGRIMNISIAPVQRHQTSRLLSAVTSPAVLIHSAVMASCAVPGSFAPVTLEALDCDGERRAFLPQRAWVDGAVSDDLPLKRLARLYGVNHTIVSQTSPLTRRITRDSQRTQDVSSILSNGNYRVQREIFNTWAQLVSSNRKSPGKLKKFNSSILSLINQEYVGDVNIVADYHFVNPFNLLDRASERQVTRLMEMGERCTWPRIEMIRLQSRISRRLDELASQYENPIQPIAGG